MHLNFTGRVLVLIYIVVFVSIEQFLAGDSVDDDTAIIRSVDAIRSLSEEESNLAYPVRLKGVFMGGADPEGIAFIIRDKTDSLYIQAPARYVAGLERGDLLEVAGVTCAGGFAPIVIADELEKIGECDIPEPTVVSMNELYIQPMDAQWIEFEGIVRSVEPKELSDAAPPPPGTLFETPPEAASSEVSKVKMKVASGAVELMVELHGDYDPKKYVDADVRFRGLCFNLHNSKRQFVKPFIQVPSGIEPEILNPPPRYSAEDEPESVGKLLRFEEIHKGDYGHRVLVRGTVLHHRSGKGLWIRDGAFSLKIESSQKEDLHPGDEIDVLGFPVPRKYSPVLEDAVFKKRSFNKIPSAILLKDFPSAYANDANLVQIEAKLTEISLFPDGVELTLEWLDRTVRAHYYHDIKEIPSDWTVGSFVRIAGICELLTNEPGPLGGLWIPRSFQLLLRSINDLEILEPSPWLNTERITWILTTFLVIALLTIAIVITQSKKRMREQLNRRAMAEAEFSAILKERNRLAREIHDTLSQGLGAISLQLELARVHADELSGDVRGYLGNAHKLTREALAEARNSIWNMRSHLLEENDLGDALVKILKRTTDELDVEWNVNVKGARRRLSPVIENNLLRIAQEAITNANKHGKPKNIEVGLLFEKRSVRLRVVDDGLGFVLNQERPVNSGSFGLVGIRERVDLLGGKVNIKSLPGDGTCIEVVVNT